MRKDRVVDDISIRQLMREKEIMKVMDHPNIVRLESYFQDPDNCYFLLELCRVGDIEQMMKQMQLKKMSVTSTRFYIAELILALEYMRHQNIIHRDLKPANLLLDDSFHLKLADFGVAKKINYKEVEQELDECDFEMDSVSVNSNEDEYVPDDYFELSEDCKTDDKGHKTMAGTYCYMSPEMITYRVA